MSKLFAVSLLLMLLTLGAGAPRAQWAVEAAHPSAVGQAGSPLSALLQGVDDDEADDVRNLILFMGDGMGAEHVRATSMYLGRPLVFESFDYRGRMTTHSMEGVTDSAAAATAMATGRRVENEVISVAVPGNGEELTTALELWQAEGRRTGLVTTSTVTDASPAAFAAHERSRDNEAQIATDYFLDSRPNILMGGGGNGVSEGLAQGAGYTIVSDAEEMLDLNTAIVTHISGQFGNDKLPPINHGREPLPTLAQMTSTALDVLEDGEDGFFLMVEQEGTDSYSHGNNLELMVDAVIELEEAVNVALDWADSHEDTLIIVTADHETGGLEIRGDNGPGELPDVRWTAGSSHTELPVPIYARGPRAPLAAMVPDITLLFHVLTPEGLVLDNSTLLPVIGGMRAR